MIAWLARRSAWREGGRQPFRVALIVLGTLILIAGASQLTRAGYSVDEEFTVFAVRGIQAHGLPLLPSGLLYDRGLAYSYAGWLASAVTGAELPAFRALSLLCAIASIYLTFRIVRRHTTERAAGLAALLVSVSLPFWATATSGRFYAPFMASYLGVLFLLGGKGWSYLGALVAVSLVSRLTHELAFTLAAIPALCLLLDDRTQRRRWLMATVAVVTGLVAAQALLFVLHYLAPSGGETMVRRFFLWQVLNLLEVPGPRQYGVVLTAMVAGWLLAPKRAGLITVLGLSGTAMVLSFSLARATNAGPLTAALVRSVLWDGAQYPLDMFLHIAAAHPVATALALGGLVARLAGAGGEWRLPERGVHLAWIGWVAWFGAIDSGITINYLLLPMSLMLAAIAIDVEGIVSHALPPVAASTCRFAWAVVALIAVGLGADQWRGTGSVVERLEAARPTIQIDGINDVRASLVPTDRVACTDELACLLLAGRIDRWLAVDDFVRERFLVTLADGTAAGVYTGVPAVFRPGDLFTPNADGTLPDRVLIVDVFKEYPIGNSRSWVPRAIELDGLQVTPLLETPQGRVLQISPAERNAGHQGNARLGAGG